MNFINLEEQIIDGIMRDTHLNEEDKIKYITAFVLMSSAKQKEFGSLWGKYKNGSAKISEGNFLLNKKEVNHLKILFQGIKDRLLLKIKSNLM